MNNTTLKLVIEECETYEACLGKLNIPSSSLRLIKLYVLLPISLIGVVFNWISYKVFSDTAVFTKRIYSYLTVYSINSAFLGLLDSVFYLMSLKVNGVILNYSFYECSFYVSYAYLPLHLTLFFFGSILDCFLVFDRIRFMTNSFRFVDSLPISAIMYGAFAYCFIVDLPVFFYSEPARAEFLLNSTSLIGVYWTSKTPFYSSSLGFIFNFIQYFLDDFCMLCLEVSLNIASCYLLRKKIKELNETMFLREQVQDISASELSLIQELKSIQRTETRLTIITIVLCSFSSLEHIFVLSANVVAKIFDNQTLNNLLNLSFVFVTLKSVSNFFVFYFVNEKFKEKINEHF